MEDSREEHWRYVDEDGDDKNNIRTLMWDVYIKEEEELINREFSVSVPYPKGVNIVCTCMQDHIIKGKEQYEAIGIHGFDYKLFEEEEGGLVREVLDGYHYLKHIIKLWTGDWVK